MRHDRYDYYISDEQLADMRYESSEALAKHLLTGLITASIFGACLVKAMFILLGV